MSLYHNQQELINSLENIKAQGSVHGALSRFHGHPNYKDVAQRFNKGIDQAIAAIDQLDPFLNLHLDIEKAEPEEEPEEEPTEVKASTPVKGVTSTDSLRQAR